MIILETERTELKSMKDVEHLNYSINEHMKTIKESLNGDKIMQLFQLMAEHSVKDAGMSFMNNKTMAKKLNVSIRTIQRYTSKLEALKVLLKVPTNRKKDNSQTSNTYVILPVLKKVCHGVCHPMNQSFKPLKQESNNNIYTNEQNENKEYPEEKIVQFVVNRVQDAMKRGTTIRHLSSYIDRVFRALERRAIYEEKMRQAREQKQREEERERQRKEALGIKEEPYIRKIPFYNWLKSD